MKTAHCIGNTHDTEKKCKNNNANAYKRLLKHQKKLFFESI